MNQGDVVYMLSGQQAEYVAASGSNHIVREMYENDDGEVELDEPRVVSSVSAQPLRPKYEADLLTLKEQIATAKSELASSRKELEKERSAFDELLKRVKTNAMLQRIDDFLEGRITHFVLVDWTGLTVVGKEQALASSEDDFKGKAQKLLYLYGDPKKDLFWRLSYYSDGSGGNGQYCIPATCHEDAMREASRICDNAYEAWRKGVRAYDAPMSLDVVRAAESAGKLGFEVPADVKEFITGRRIADAQSTVNELSKKLAEAEAKLAAAQS